MRDACARERMKQIMHSDCTHCVVQILHTQLCVLTIPKKRNSRTGRLVCSAVVFVFLLCMCLGIPDSVASLVSEKCLILHVMLQVSCPFL